MHAPPGATMHAPREQPRMPPWEQPRMPPWEQPRMPPPGATMHPPEQSRTSPPVDRITDTCKNITFPQLPATFAGGKKFEYNDFPLRADFCKCNCPLKAEPRVFKRLLLLCPTYWL